MNQHNKLQQAIAILRFLLSVEDREVLHASIESVIELLEQEAHEE
jgi:hypothetical protein